MRKKLDREGIANRNPRRKTRVKRSTSGKPEERLKDVDSLETDLRDQNNLQLEKPPTRGTWCGTLGNGRPFGPTEASRYVSPRIIVKRGW
jgi:hypothetical protein